MNMHFLTWMAVASLVSGCAFDEGLVIEDMTGRVVVPRAFATRTMPNGETVEADARLIGPVYLGFYPEVRTDQFGYPHPEQGPSLGQGLSGDTYPYGGTSVGDIRFPCVQDLVCRLTSGRFTDYDDILTWFSDYYQDPITTSIGEPITTGEFIRQTCFENLRVTSDAEVRITAWEDKNEDGELNKQDLEFVENADGDMEAEFKVWQQEYVPGFKLWAFMDTPSRVDGRLTSCDSTEGTNVGQYVDSFQGGRPFRFLLNRPDTYITEGDVVSSTPHEYASVDDDVTITLDFEVLE
jgi:hypothetical protein